MIYIVFLFIFFDYILKKYVYLVKMNLIKFIFFYIVSFQMTNHANNDDISSILANLRAQADNYVPKKKIIISELAPQKHFYSDKEVLQPSKHAKDELHSIVSNIFRNNDLQIQQVSKYNCYHMFCKHITMFRNSNYPDLPLSTSILKEIWKKVVADNYKPQFQQTAKLFNVGRRGNDIFPKIDYSIYFREFKLIELMSLKN
jgi:hypothetical protein